MVPPAMVEDMVMVISVGDMEMTGLGGEREREMEAVLICGAVAGLDRVDGEGRP